MGPFISVSKLLDDEERARGKEGERHAVQTILRTLPTEMTYAFIMNVVKMM